MKRAFSPLLWLFVTVFFIRALIPAGFMPDLSGQQVLEICSGTGLSTIAVDENNQPLPDQDRHATPKSCPFSFLSTAYLTNPNDGMAFISAPLATSEGMVAFILSGILPLSLQNHHLSRAPPIFS